MRLIQLLLSPLFCVPSQCTSLLQYLPALLSSRKFYPAHYVFLLQDSVVSKFVKPADMNVLHRAAGGLTAGGIASFMCCPIEVRQEETGVVQGTVGGA